MLIRCRNCNSKLAPDKSQCRVCRTWNIAATQEVTLLSTLGDEQDDEVQKICSRTWWGEIMGGGLPSNCSILFGGEPGAGKSTFALQCALDCIRETGRPALYIPVEEAKKDIRPRARRIGFESDELNLVAMVEREMIEPELEFLSGIPSRTFSLAIIDSLPALVNRNEEMAVKVCEQVHSWSKERDIPVLILDHVTKDHDFAGLKALQHYVDMTVYLREYVGKPRRTWTTIKNRFGVGQTSVELIMSQKGKLEVLTQEKAPTSENPVFDTSDFVKFTHDNHE